VLWVLWSPSPTLSSSLSTPWPLYYCHHHYQPWTECAHIHLQSVGCGQQILLENLCPKIQFSTFSAESKNVIVKTITMRHCEIPLWWVQWRYGSDFDIDWRYDFYHNMPPTTHYPSSASRCLVAATLLVSQSNTKKDIWKHIVKWNWECVASWESTWKHTSAKVQIDYRLCYAHTRTRAAHSKLPMDPCATRSL
jgi:hypothetical protein